MDPFKVGGDLSSLIALKGADEMPARQQMGIGVCGCHSLDFCHALLHVVFAKVMVPSGFGLEHGARRVRLANSHQAH